MTQNPLKQSDHSFTVGPRFQTVWGLREAFVFALEGIGAVGFLGFAAAGHVTGMIGALLCMIGAVVLLLSHLGKPMLAWRAIINIRYSWISRGTVAIGLFTGLGCVYVGGLTIPSLEFIGNLNVVLVAGTIITGVFVLFYPGLAMRASAGIAFWSTPLLPLLSFLHGSLTGALLVVVATGEPITRTVENDFTTTCVSLITLIAFATYMHIRFMRRRGGASKLSADWLITEERLIFWVLAMGMGLALPLALLMSNPTNAYLLVGVVLARIIGDIAFRYTVLKVGAYESVA